jgi:hypothetical protein
MGKFGTKSMRNYAIGMKHGIHQGAKLGQKSSRGAIALAPLVGLGLGPEAGIALEAGGMVGKKVSNALEKISR